MDGGTAESGFFDYRDAELLVRLPRYLKPKKGIRYFARPGRQQRLPGVSAAAIELIDATVAEGIRDTIRNAAKVVSQPDVQFQVLRLGAPAYMPNGLECLACSRIMATGDIVYQYSVVYPLGRYHVYATFSGRGEMATFDKSCCAITSSIQLLRPA